MRKRKLRRDEPGFQEAFAVLKRTVEEALAKRPPEAEAAAPDRTRRPELAAESDLFRAEMAYRIQAIICVDPSRCAKHRCRRLGRCPELEDIAQLREEQRARVARERAAAGKRPQAPLQPQRNH